MLSPWITALIVGGVAAAAGGLAHDIQGFASGQTPWDNPGEWATGALKAGGLGFAGGVLGGAIGPALGAAGDALGIGSSAGTVAAGAGAPVGGGASASGIVPAGASEVIAGGTTAPEGTLGSTLANAGLKASEQAVSGAATGALKDTSNPLRGAVTGAVGGAASGGLNFVGQSTGMIPNTSANYQPMGDMGASQQSMMALSPTYMPPSVAPGMGTQIGQGAYGLGSRLAVGGAQQGVGAMMAPPPPPISPNQGLPGGYRPYWARSPYA